MVLGNGLWNSRIENSMSFQRLDKKTFYTFENLPINLYQALTASKAKYPNKIAIVDNQGTAFTYSDLTTLVDQFSSYLIHTVKISKGNHIGLMMYNSIEYCISYLALSKIGAVTVALPSKFKETEILSLIEKADVRLVICDECFKSYFNNYTNNPLQIITSSSSETGYGFSHLEFNSLPSCVSYGSLEDPAIIMFTSGTTAQSKGVLIRNYNIMHAVLSYQRILDITCDDKSIIATPIYHITGLVALLGLFIYAGGCLYLHKRFNALQVLKCVKEHNITFLHASPTVFIKLLELKNEYPSLPSLRCFACGSSNMPVEKLRKLHDWLPFSSFHTVYGLTETTSPATIFPGDACTSKYIGSSGIPIPGVDIKIIDELGNELPTEQVGEILLRGTVVINEYYKSDFNKAEADTWLRTGDLGYLNFDNYLFVVDRKKDMINRGGEKIWSFDIENELFKLPYVEEAAVVGIPHEIYGEVPAAIVRLSSGSAATPDDIFIALSNRLAKYQIPQKIVFADCIPKTPNDKIDKKQIRQLLS